MSSTSLLEVKPCPSTHFYSKEHESLCEDLPCKENILSRTANGVLPLMVFLPVEDVKHDSIVLLTAVMFLIL